MDFNKMVQVWMGALTQPGEEFFEMQRKDEDATLTTALVWMGIAAVVAAVLGICSTAVGYMFGGAATNLAALDEFLPPELVAELGPLLESSATSLVAEIISGFFMTLFFVPIFFFIGVLFYWVIAKMFGGSGSLETQAYLMATYAAPLAIISAGLGIIPVLGGCIAFFVAIYQVVLNYFAIKVTHNLSGGQALAVVLTPIILIFLCVCCLLFFVTLAAGASA